MTTVLNILPTEKEIEQVKSWLFSEYDKYDEGFYCNWNIIQKAYDAKELFTFIYRNRAIGFVVFTKIKDYINYISVDIFDIEPKYRKKGFGTLFYSLLEEKFQNDGFVAMKLFCAPAESEKFWRKMNFIPFPQGIKYTHHELSFYKPLIEVQSPNENIDENNIVELWNKEPYEIHSGDNANWIWKIKENGILEKPILLPCYNDWQIRWIKNGETVIEEKIKRFQQKESKQFSFGSFLYIKKLKKPTK